MSKEKAIKLVKKFEVKIIIHITQATNGYEIWLLAKECAIIACERTIDILKEIQEKEHSDNFWYLENAILEETQTIEEIKKL
jgi:hypothetical protein